MQSTEDAQKTMTEGESHCQPSHGTSDDGRIFALMISPAADLWKSVLSQDG